MDRLSQIALCVLAAIALIASLNAISDLAAPMALALVIGVVLSPVTYRLERVGFTPALSAMAGLTLSVLVLGGMAFLLQPLAAEMLEQAPKVWADVQDLVKALRGLLHGLSEAGQEVSSVIVPQANAAPPVVADPGMEVPSVTDALMIAPAVAAQLLTFVGTLFFFLLTRDEIYDWAARRVASPSNRGTVAARLREAERIVSKYFLTISLINICLGIATGAALHLIGVRDAMLWGILACLLNFVVYLGPALLIIALLFLGVATFDGGQALLPALAFAGLNFIEGQFVTPALVGKSLRLNPLVVFIALLFGIWLWGGIGGIVAIPLLLWGQVLSKGLASP